MSLLTVAIAQIQAPNWWAENKADDYVYRKRERANKLPGGKKYTAPEEAEQMRQRVLDLVKKCPGKTTREIFNDFTVIYGKADVITKDINRRLRELSERGIIRSTTLARSAGHFSVKRWWPK